MTPSLARNKIVAELGISCVGTKLLVYSLLRGTGLLRGPGPRLSGRSSLFGKRVARVCCVRGSSAMVDKSFVVMLVATLLGPALGVGLFILLNNL